jgi:hypothetical protein
MFPSLVNFGTNHSDNPVTISASGPSIAGSTFSLTCSVILIDPLPLPSNVPPPSFEWFYGPHGNASLPSGVTPTETVPNYNCMTYASTLKFSPALYESHAGKYTCQLGAGRLMNSTVISVDGMIIYSQQRSFIVHVGMDIIMHTFQSPSSLNQSIEAPLKNYDCVTPPSYV